MAVLFLLDQDDLKIVFSRFKNFIGFSPQGGRTSRSRRSFYSCS
jgi:hypothetical protein